MSTQNASTEYPLAIYAAECWTKHSQRLGDSFISIQESCLELCLGPKKSYANWGPFYEHRPSWGRSYFKDSVWGKKIFASPLYYASASGFLGPIELLLDSVVDVDAKDGWHESALSVASCQGNEDVVQLLLGRGAEVNQNDTFHKTALCKAKLKRYCAISRLLLEHRVDVNKGCEMFGPPLVLASSTECEALVRLFLEKGAVVNAGEEHNRCALQMACGGGHETVAKQLLDSWADVDSLNGPWGTPLIVATKAHSVSMVQLLLDRGADANIQSQEEYKTALEVAWEKEYTEIAEILKSA